eukprot:189973_1
MTSGNEEAKVDITYAPQNGETSVYFILVHGLNGNHKTFINKHNNESLQRLLSLDFPSSTILTYNYPNKRTRSFDGSQPFDTVKERANNFLTLILPYIEPFIEDGFVLVDDNEQKSSEIPLFFIGHSMGGLIIKSALEIASNTCTSENYSIYERFIGCAFYATPHRGSAIANLYQRLMHHVPYLGPTPAIKNLLKDDHELVQLMQSFNKLIANHPIVRYNKYKNIRCILSLIEGQNQPVLLFDKLTSTKIVDYASSMCFSAFEKPVKLDYYHTNICQPKNAQDPRYMQLAFFLKKHIQITSSNHHKTQIVNVNNIITNHFDFEQKNISHKYVCDTNGKQEEKKAVEETESKQINEIFIDNTNMLRAAILKLEQEYAECLFDSKVFLVKRLNIIKSILDSTQIIINKNNLEEIVMQMVMFGLKDETHDKITEHSLFDQWQKVNHDKVVVTLELKNLKYKIKQTLHPIVTHVEIAKKFNESVVYDEVMKSLFQKLILECIAINSICKSGIDVSTDASIKKQFNDLRSHIHNYYLLSNKTMKIIDIAHEKYYSNI